VKVKVVDSDEYTPILPVIPLIPLSTTCDEGILVAHF